MHPVDARDRLVDVIRADLVGPATPDEILPITPSRFYLTGFLVPFEGGEQLRLDPESSDDLAEDGADPADDDGASPDEAPKHKILLPASLGVSVLVPATVQSLEVHASWGDYIRDESPTGADPAAAGVPEGEPKPRERERSWRRVPRSKHQTIAIDPAAGPTPIAIEEALGEKGMELVVLTRKRSEGEGYAVSVFLVNRRPPATPRDAAFAFQAALSLQCDQGFTARPNLRGRDDGQGAAGDFDEQTADLQYRDVFEYAAGHGVGTTARLDPDGACRNVEAAWIPSANVEKVVPAERSEMDLGMDKLAVAEDLGAALRPLAEAYEAWIDEQAKATLPEEAHRRVLAALMDNARYVKRRIAEGIDALSKADTADAALAFRIANRAMARAAKAKRPDKAPRWYPFQLAFLLMNIPGILDPSHASRRDVDLLFFPTGGGKTEAYLGLAAFTLAHRRLRHPGIEGAGVSVLMRYTRSLLTLDQLERAAALICALELERDKEPRLGAWPFEIGLWLGKGATPNRMGKKGDRNTESVREKTLAYRRQSKGTPIPIPIERCPSCHTDFRADSFRLAPDEDNPKHLYVRCVNSKCVWSGHRHLPIVAVDEPLYRRLPCLLIATVDKFAQLPWVGETGALFGRVSRHDRAGFYGPADDPRVGAPLPGGRLPPPDLVIQDDLHLIAGPLGAMVGLYEAAIDALAEDASGARPKVVASTATARRAGAQVRALFARPEAVIFPPPGPDRRDSFFARTAPMPRSMEERGDKGYAHARRYIGVAAPGRSLKVTMLRTYLALLSGAARIYEEAGGHSNPTNPAASYMTLVGYFNSLREIRGARRIVEDEVTTRLYAYDRRIRHGVKTPVFAKRSIGEVVELTSREPMGRVAESKRRLSALPREREKKPVDVALATNMIAAGLDSMRLGLMVVLGQPKMTAEYIQATSRVGRDESRPGLVVTLFNVHRPRDRAHYERFEPYHESFYRPAEALSVTPFSPRAIDRGAAAVTVALARLLEPTLTPSDGAGRIADHRPIIDAVQKILDARQEAALSPEDAAGGTQVVPLAKRALELFDAWIDMARREKDARAALRYARAEKDGVALLYDPLEAPPADAESAKLKVQRSLRDGEPSVSLFVKVPHIEVA
jgi:hypothetical protein